MEFINVLPMGSSHHLVIPKIMTTTLTCIGSFKFLLDKLSKSTLLVLMLNPIQAAGKYAFYLVSLIRRRNNLIYLFSKTISVMIIWPSMMVTLVHLPCLENIAALPYHQILSLQPTRSLFISILIVLSPEMDFT